MYIIIVGGGRLGYSLTKALLGEGHEILLIERDAVVCDIINKELGGICLRGDACETAIQAEAGTGRARCPARMRRLSPACWLVPAASPGPVTLFPWP